MRGVCSVKKLLGGEEMKKFLITLFMVMALVVTGVIGREIIASPQNETALLGAVQEGNMAYCTIADLNAAYGEDRITGWSRLNPDTVDRAITDAGAEIDGYLLSGGYPVPLPGAPETLKKYCIDIASANLVVSAGVLKDDPGGNAVLDQAKIARRYLEKVAEGKFKIPGYSEDVEQVKPPTGNILVSSGKRLDLRGY
jgi:phage gp36-like protein